MMKDLSSIEEGIQYLDMAEELRIGECLITGAKILEMKRKDNGEWVIFVY